MLEAISPISVWPSFFQPRVPTLTGWNTNGLQLKPLEGNTAVVWINSFLSIHNMSFYNALAIVPKPFWSAVWLMRRLEFRERSQRCESGSENGKTEHRRD